MKKYPKIDIIIPLYVISDRFFSDLKYYEKLEYPNFQLVIVCDKKIKLPVLKGAKVKLLLTHKKHSGPAEKRDIALFKTNAEICAFIDDDAYPDKKWLINAAKLFENNDIVALGGPGLTPKEDTYWEKLTGIVYSSFFCGGSAQYRFVKGKRQFVDDYPAYNLLIRTKELKAVGGYDSYFYGGEDTFLCLKLITKGWKILYDPEVIVFHHRRALFMPYLRQIANIGKHRGYFAKKFPQTSRRFIYFLPSLLTIGFFLFLLLSFINKVFFVIFFSLFVICFLIGMASIKKQTTLWNAFLVSWGIILTHISYGIYFLKGLFTRELIS